VAGTERHVNRKRIHLPVSSNDDGARRRKLLRLCGLTAHCAAEQIRRMHHLHRFVFAAVALMAVALPAARAQDNNPLPFSVTIGGQAAEVKAKAADALFGTIEKPVPPNAPIEVGVKADMTIINVVAADEKGTPAEGAIPAILLLQGGSTTTLDKTMDGKKLSPGNYLMSIVAAERTARVFLKVQ
jgi:hypothetical protein